MKYNENQFKDIEILCTASDNSLTLLSKYNKIKYYEQGTMIFFEREYTDYIYIVISGMASIYKTNENGQKKVIFILDSGKLLNEVILENLPEAVNCEAFEDCTLLEINKEVFINIMESDFMLTKKVMNSLSNKIRRMYRQLKNTPSSIKIDKKLVAKLYKLARDHGISCDDGIMIDMNISITYLADLLGSQRETVSRSIKLLQDKRLILLKNKRIIVPNINKLSDYFKTQ